MATGADEMKGKLSVDMILKIILGLAVVAVIVAVVMPLLGNAQSAAQGCGALRSWIQDLSAGGLQMC